MMNLLQAFLAFDQKTVDVLESFCHKQQRLLGTSHYLWLKFFAVGHAVLILIFKSESSPPNNLEMWVAGGLAACVPLFSWWEKKSLSRLLQGVANPLRIIISAVCMRYVLAYVITPFLTLVAIVNLIYGLPWVSLGMMMWWLTLASLFLLPACDPLPPTGGKCWEALQSIFLTRAAS
jgi:hypothetical protein